MNDIYLTYLMSGSLLYIIRKHQPILTKKGWVQVVVLLIVIPAMVHLASIGYINEDTISMLFGTVLGYFFRDLQL
jgi:hypothetical protein